MSSIPGYSLEAWIEWNHSVDRGSPKFAAVLAIYEPKREWVEDKLMDFDEENQSWRAYNSAVFNFDPEFEASVANLLKLDGSPDPGPSTLGTQIADAKAHIRKLKEVNPKIFPEWSRLKMAEQQLAKAQAEVDAARAAWDRVGS